MPMILLLLYSLLQQIVGKGNRKERRKSVRVKDRMTKSWERKKKKRERRRRRKRDVLRITEWKEEKRVRVERIRTKEKKEWKEQ